MSSPSIGDYALIGDCRAAGLVSRDGSLDWLCFPRYDSPSLFGALLDPAEGGCFRIRPVGAFQVERRYLPNTAILETTFRTPGGAIALRDLMPVTSEEGKRAGLWPDHQVLRELEGLEGAVDIEVQYDPRPDYARRRMRLERRGALGLWGRADGAVLALHSAVPLELASDHLSAHGVARIQAGEQRHFSLIYEEEMPAVIPLLGEPAHLRLEQSARWWRNWVAPCSYQGPYRDAVIRSALTLKLMAFAPSGAVVAAPTTALPEKLGGVRNWDYRYCWLRDASLTMRALFALGYDEEAGAFAGWMLYTTRLTWPELQVVYNVYGESHLPERELPELHGFAGSRPVRIGNDAHSQFQLDVYGEVIDGVTHFAARGGRFDQDTIRMLDGLGHTVCRRWREPDDGIWEGRAGRFHHTHSKVLCWVALDRLVRLHDEGHVRVCADEFRVAWDAVRTEIETHGYNEGLASYTRTFDGAEMDASLLVLPIYEYLPATHPRMRSTLARIQEKLARHGLVYRYESATDDGLPPGEGAFGICSFWAVECMARSGDLDGATRAFEQLLARANDVGLLAEEFDPETGAALGNFPQAFTHVGLINAALTLEECRAEAAAAGSHSPSTAAIGGGRVLNRRSAVLWGFTSTLVMTGLMAGSQGLGITRMNLPFIMGTMFTPDRDRAEVTGFFVHVANGWVFAFLYAAVFESWGRASWWLGSGIGLLHALFVLLAGMPLLSTMHPRMASEQYGPTPTKQLEPPGFLALNYGRRTPISVMLAHLLYGAILGAFYRLEKQRTTGSEQP